MNRLIVYACSTALCVGVASLSPAQTSADTLRERGQAIFAESCADCHGDQGQGVEGVYANPLVGDDSIGQLTSYISEMMPEGSPEDCTGEDAQAVAEYMHHAFYSEAAQIRNRPPKILLTRLTANQLQQSFSDLYANFFGVPEPVKELGVGELGVREFGVNAEYFDGDRWNRKDRKLERVDPVIDFDFGHESPAADIKAEAFSIRWEGGLLAKVSGRYEIVVRSTCSFVMDFGHDDREFIDNHVQSGDKTEFRQRVHLTAGRVYPFEIRFRQRERKTELPPARISLSWVPPEGDEEIIPEHHLIARRVPAAYALQSDLPPDDRSYGYERGISVSREWDESTTQAALEFAQIAYDELWPQYQRSHREEQKPRRELLRGFLIEVVESAFRSPLADPLQEVFIDRPLSQEPDDAEAIKRVCLLSLKSARFLYPMADQHQSPSQRVANRLALVLYDSLPVDKELKQLVLRQELDSEEAVRQYCQRQVDDFRVRAKTREMLYAWLNLRSPGEIAKDAEKFAGFDEPLIHDLRRSLDRFLDSVVWSESSDFRQLFLAKSSFTNPRIAEYYGSAWQPAAPATETSDQSVVGLQRHPRAMVPSVESAAHWGVLNHPYLMSELAYHDSTSPIHRGIFLIRYMLGRTLRPPADAFSPLSPDLHPDLTTRERVELQTSPTSCQVCHQKINGLGFAMENFDAVGRYREQERAREIDASGHYVDRQGNRIEFSGVEDLANYLADSDDSRQAFVARAFQHFVKQPPAAYGADTL
ncbi:MAG: DUF1588 domain-containing protein, partial [bacterium]|nr:DUF1588 domain-containing protein [bacterium]